MDNSLIKRQDAIKAIAEFLYYPNNFDGMREGFDLSDWAWKVEAVLSGIPSADVPNINVGGMISRKQAVEAMGEEPMVWTEDDEYAQGQLNMWEAAVEALKELPPVEPDLSEAYAKAVLAWLLEYQIKAAELNGKYLPYEVLSWVVNDWRKEHE